MLLLVADKSILNLINNGPLFMVVVRDLVRFLVLFQHRLELNIKIVIKNKKVRGNERGERAIRS